MGQNRKNWKSESVEQLVEDQRALHQDEKNEKRLFYVQIIIICLLIALSICRETFFPSEIVVLNLIKSIFY